MNAKKIIDQYLLVPYHKSLNYEDVWHHLILHLSHIHFIYLIIVYDKNVTLEINVYLSLSPCSRGLWCLERPASILEIGILMGLLGLCQKIAHWHFRIRSPRILKWVNTI